MDRLAIRSDKAGPRGMAKWRAGVSVLLGLWLVWQAPAAWASSAVVVSRADAPVGVVRQTQAFTAQAGHLLQSGDILEIQAGKHLQIEAGQNCLLSLEGPARVLLQKIEGERSGPVRLLILEGWLKVQAAAGSTPVVVVDSAVLRVTLRGGSALMHAVPERFEVFSEDSTPRLATLEGGGRAGNETDMGREQLAERQAGQQLKVKPRPPPDFVKSIPMDLRDTLIAVANKAIADPPKLSPQPVSFALIEPWLTAPGGLRQGLAARFRSRIQDPGFRAQIEDHLAQLPEWHDILHPPPPKQESNDIVIPPPRKPKPIAGLQPIHPAPAALPSHAVAVGSNPSFPRSI